MSIVARYNPNPFSNAILTIRLKKIIQRAHRFRFCDNAFFKKNCPRLYLDLVVNQNGGDHSARAQRVYAGANNFAEIKPLSRGSSGCTVCKA